jgi:hypothetical protein
MWRRAAFSPSIHYLFLNEGHRLNRSAFASQFNKTLASADALLDLDLIRNSHTGRKSRATARSSGRLPEPRARRSSVLPTSSGYRTDSNSTGLITCVHAVRMVHVAYYPQASPARHS